MPLKTIHNPKFKTMAKTKKDAPLTKAQAEKEAAAYQRLARQVKELEAQLKPHKEALLQFAKANPEAFDEAFQIKFKNGTYVGLRVNDVLDASEEARQLLLDNLEEEYILVSLNDKLVIDAAKKNNRFMKRLTACGAGIGQKEVLAVYAG